MAEGGAQQGINTAIASGAAFGGGGQGAANPKAFQGAGSLIPVKGLNEAGGALFKDVQLAQGSLNSLGGFGEMLGSMRGAGSPLKGLFDMFESGKEAFKIFADKPPTNASDTNASASGGSANAHSAVSEIANPLLEAGMVYRGEFSMAQNIAPDNTPRRGAARSTGMGME